MQNLADKWVQMNKNNVDNPWHSLNETDFPQESEQNRIFMYG